MPLKRAICHGSVGGKVKVHLTGNFDADHDFRGLEKAQTQYPEQKRLKWAFSFSKVSKTSHAPNASTFNRTERFESRQQGALPPPGNALFVEVHGPPHAHRAS